MPAVTPYIPEYITVHLGSPSSNAANVTVSFSDYVKNVASSEIYPTWDESALRANILAIVSYALNRVYTEFYRSRGYDFEITNNTAFDQAFVSGRSYFENISRLVDELFNDYLRRPGFVEPLAAKFCNGTTVTCQGLSQWGSQNLARQGYSYDQILRSYYGNVEIVPNAPIRGITASYPGKKMSKVDYTIYYVPSPDDYTTVAWPLNDDRDYNELLNNIEVRAARTQVYLGVGTIAYFVSEEKPQLAVMYCSDDGTTRPVLLENQTKTTWKVGEYYNIYCDAYGVYNGMPWLIARYTY